ncbi:hypothetical protein AVEN_143576-1 [Araneus ventricosus]|uniref:Uncharacterized protein n=1 Tax=Araneus ventricosus TaxID=182803 RepID=A0A4Y2AN77_ARAVE|nr:hypothetical protein AVEN_143576-1 [Araneus ventricosus]
MKFDIFEKLEVVLSPVLNNQWSRLKDCQRKMVLSPLLNNQWSCLKDCQRKMVLSPLLNYQWSCLQDCQMKVQSCHPENKPRCKILRQGHARLITVKSRPATPCQCEDVTNREKNRFIKRTRRDLKKSNRC